MKHGLASEKKMAVNEVKAASKVKKNTNKILLGAEGRTDISQNSVVRPSSSIQLERVPAKTQ